MKNPIGLLVSAALLLGPAATARAAAGDAACCLQTTSRLNGLIDPVNKGSGDEQFFTSKKTMPNVMIVIDQSLAMHAWPKKWADVWVEQGKVAGCGARSLNSLGFNEAKGGTSCSDNAWTTSCGFVSDHDEFRPGTFYRVGEKGCMADYGAAGCSNLGTVLATACTGTSDSAKCQQCLNESLNDPTDRSKGAGYYLDTDGSGNLRVLITGRFGQFYKPRDTMVRDLVRDIKRVTVATLVRQGFITTRKQTGGSLKVSPWYSDGTASGKSCIHLINKASEPVFTPKCGVGSDPNLSSPLNMLDKKMTFDKEGATNNCGFPLPDILYATAYALRGPAGSAGDPFADWFPGFSTPYIAKKGDPDPYNSLTNDFSSMCGSCYFNAVVVITSGTITTDQYVNRAPMAAKLDSATENPCANCSDTAKMAKWFWKNDLRANTSSVTWGSKAHLFPGDQNMATYFVSLTDRASSELTKVAKVGGGQVYLAQTGQGLVDALNQALNDVITRSTSFSAASVSFLQNATTTLNAVMPRMTPARAPEPWKGQLWHFRLFNEFVQERDLNNDKDTADIFITDKNETIVTENEEGKFIKAGGTSEVKPVDVDWEAADRLYQLGHSARKIWTVLDTSGDGQLTDAYVDSGTDRLVEFKEDNLDALLPYLGIVGRKDASGTSFCPVYRSLFDIEEGLLLNELELTWVQALNAVGWDLDMTGWSATAGQEAMNKLCAKVLIQWVRGQDLRDEDGDGSKKDTRESIFGDIFHSSPVTVTAPVDAFLCDLGLSNQCVRTLYATQLGNDVDATPLASYKENETDCKGNPKPRNAYEKYAYTWRKRQELVIVGANDGMLHAFDNGTPTEECLEGGLSEITPQQGNGDEVWAFIPPDLLSRLADSVIEHTYLVDGDIMVRDIWNDDDKDGEKGYDEYRTVAVVAEGRGGAHYFALELLFDESTGAAKSAPGFRWMFPQPCTAEASEFGKTLYSLSPKPPPLGPLLIDTATLGSADKTSKPVTRYTRPTQEQWMVALSGGWSPSLSLGRGVYFVDAFRGKVNGRKDNLWWKMTYQPSAADSDLVNKPLREMRYSIVAPVALLDFGENGKPALDGFFDTAIVGDTGGQVWLARMQLPGKVDSTSGLVNNWSGGRAFEQEGSLKSRYPIWFLASTAIQTDYGYLRAFFGGGDRYAALEKYAGSCNFYNPLACVKYGCTDVAVNYETSRSPVNATAGITWTTAGSPLTTTVASTRTEASSTAGACGAASARYSAYGVSGCTLGAADKGTLVSGKVDCAKSGDFYACNRTDASAPKYEDLIGGVSKTVPDETTLAALRKPRFYGTWVYGGPRTFVEDGSVEAKAASVFDGARLTDASLCDTTGVTCTATACSGGPTSCPAGSSNTGYGWFLEYHDQEPTPTTASLEHKTATGAVIMASCVLWNSIYPKRDEQTITADDCGVFIKSEGRFYQSDFISGAPNCAYSFLKADKTYARFQKRDVLAPPPEPATVVQISKSGNVKYSALLLEPGAAQATEVGVSQSSDLLQTIYELPVSRAMHECRHGDQDNCVVTAP